MIPSCSKIKFSSGVYTLPAVKQVEIDEQVLAKTCHSQLRLVIDPVIAGSSPVGYAWHFPGQPSVKYAFARDKHRWYIIIKAYLNYI